ncbi:hypothetical protein [Silicimonas sp. MF1-12-2]
MAEEQTKPLKDPKPKSARDTRTKDDARKAKPPKDEKPPRITDWASI